MDGPVQKEVLLAGPFGNSVPPIVVAGALRAIVPAARSSTFMAIEGRGRLSGRPPKWAIDVGDIRFRGASAGQNEMVLKFLVPRIGQAVPHLYKQRDFWKSPPSEDATPLDLLTDVVRDVSIEDQDSDTYDQAVLRDIERLGRVFAEGDTRIELPDLTSNGSIRISKATIDHVRALSRSTPPPYQVRVVGTLDMIRASTQGFALKLDDGSEISGIYEKGEISDLQPLFRQRVAVNGALIFRPSGRPLRLDAMHVKLAGSESSIWSRLPGPSDKVIDVRELHQFQSKKTGINAVIGQWPSDETDEEVLTRLVNLS
jgi:hypothetical protein